MKTTMRYQLTSVIMAIIKKSINNQFWKILKKMELFYTVGGNVDFYGHYGE